MEVLKAVYTRWQALWRRLIGGVAQPVCIRRKTLITLCMLPIALCSNLSSRDAYSQRVYDEYQVKAVFIYNCMLFVEWPNESAEDKKEPYKICILGEDPFGEYIDTIAKAKKVKTRSIVIERIKSIEEFTSAHILFISQNEQKNQKEIQEVLRDKPVLTIADYPGFAKDGGAIELLLINKRVNFRVNQKTTNQAKLRISAQFLSLATEIIRDPEEGSAE